MIVFNIEMIRPMSQDRYTAYCADHNSYKSSRKDPLELWPRDTNMCVQCYTMSYLSLISASWQSLEPSYHQYESPRSEELDDLE